MKNGHHNTLETQGDILKLLVLLNKLSKKIFNLVSHMTEKSSKGTHFKSWNQGIFGHFDLKNYIKDPNSSIFSP